MRKPNRYDSTPSRNMPLINMCNIKTVSGIIVQNIQAIKAECVWRAKTDKIKSRKYINVWNE